MTGFIRPYRGAQLRCTCDRDSCEGCATFKTFFGRITNADRIREMTDEELAEWMSRATSFCYFDECPAKDVGNEPDGFVWCGSEGNCIQAWINWLKSEVEK